MPDSRKRRADDADYSRGGGAPKQLSHRLLARGHHGGRQQQGTAAAAASKQRPTQSNPPPPTEETIGILEGITRGSIANMVLARLGKLNPNELIGPAPSRPPRVDQSHQDDETDDDDVDDNGSSDEGEEEESHDEHDGHVEQEEGDEQNNTTKKTGRREEIFFYESVQPQPPSFHDESNERKGIYFVQSGPYAGSRGTLHPISAPGYFVLQTDDGSVATVHQSQVQKTDSGLPRGRAYTRVKLTSEDKKTFVENVKRHLVEGDGHAAAFSARPGDAARQQAETANALKIAMNTLDPRRDVFRVKRPYRKQPKPPRPLTDNEPVPR